MVAAWRHEPPRRDSVFSYDSRNHVAGAGGDRVDCIGADQPQLPGRINQQPANLGGLFAFRLVNGRVRRGLSGCCGWANSAARTQVRFASNTAVGRLVGVG
jgi:hypothetical protein